MMKLLSKYMHKNFIILLFALGSLSFFSKSVNAFDLILDRNFGMKTFCLSGLEGHFTDSNDSTFSQPLKCQRLCHIDSYSSKQYMSFLQVDKVINLSFDMDNFGNQPYSYIQVEFIHQIGINFNIELRMLSTTPQQIELESNIKFGYPSIVMCQYTGQPQKYNLVYSSIKMLASDIPSLPQFKLDLYNSIYSTFLYQLHSISITRNCIINCVLCSTSISCAVCANGYQRFTLDSGESVCEIVSISSIQNCQRFTRSQQNEQVCRKCNPGYSLDASQQCVSNNDQSPCNSYEYFEDGKCSKYGSVGYYEIRDGSYVKISEMTEEQIQLTYLCPYGTLAIIARLSNYSQYSCRCFIENCISCSDKSICDRCVKGYSLSATNETCEKVTFSTNTFTLEQKQTDKGYEIRVKFISPLILSSLSTSDFVLSILDFQAYTMQFDSIENNTTMVFKVEMLDAAKNKEMTLKFTNKDFIESNLLEKTEDTVKLSPYVQLSESERESAKTAETVGVAVSSAITSTLLIIVIISNFSAIVSTIDLTGFLYYLLYIEARFPINIVSFYAVFKNFQLDFIPNPFTDLVSQGYMQLSNVRFMQSDTDGYFLISTGQSITIFLLIVIMYLIAKLFSKIDVPLVSNYFKKSVKETWEYGGYFDAVWTIYLYLLIGVMMQFQSFDCSDSSCGWNYFIFSVSFIVSFGVPALIYKLIRRNPNLKDDKEMKEKISSLIAGVRLYSLKEQNESLDDSSSKLAVWRDKYSKKLSKYYMLILYLRKILFGLIIVCLNTSGYSQITLISLLNIAMALYFLLLRPLESAYENYKGAISEGVLIVFQILVGILIDDPDTQEEEYRINIGWAAISIVSFVILWHTVGIIFDFLMAIWAALKAMVKKRLESAKVAPLNQVEGSPNNKNVEEFVNPSGYLSAVEMHEQRLIAGETITAAKTSSNIEPREN